MLNFAHRNPMGISNGNLLSAINWPNSPAFLWAYLNILDYTGPVEVLDPTVHNVTKPTLDQCGVESRLPVLARDDEILVSVVDETEWRDEVLAKTSVISKL